MIDAILLPMAAFAVAALVGGLVRALAPSLGLIDRPNARSSHTRPVARGGGLGIVVAFLLCLLSLLFAGGVDETTVLALLVGGGFAAIIGFLDDLGQVPTMTRLVLHGVAAAMALLLLGGLPPVAFGREATDLGWFGHVTAWLGLVWMLNLYNFMDGIDGIAAVQAITVGLGAALLLAVNGHDGVALVPLCLAAASAGFLVWNVPVARIFMGDVGSGFLGVTVGLLLIVWARLDSAMLWAMLILMAVFIVDSGWTLIVRIANGERPHEAHRSHAYQIAARRLNSHLNVTMIVALINLLWLLPLAWCAIAGILPGSVGFVVACAPLLALAVWLGAGLPEPHSRSRWKDVDAPH